MLTPFAYVCKMLSYILNAIGLIVEIIGVILLFKHGFDADFSEKISQLFALEGKKTVKSIDEINKEHTSKRKWAFRFLLIGFALQFASVLVGAFFFANSNAHKERTEHHCHYHNTCRCYTYH